MLVAGELWHDNSFWNWMWESWKVPFSCLSVLIKFIGYRTWSHMSLNPSHLRPSMYLINGLQSQKTITFCLDLSLFFQIYSPIFISTIFIRKTLCNIPDSFASSYWGQAKWRRGKDEWRHFSPCLICRSLLEAIDHLCSSNCVPQTFSYSPQGSQHLSFRLGEHQFFNGCWYLDYFSIICLGF